ncbi:hypothetical protein ACWKTS_05005 [Bacillus toyonensis]|uniref:Uncharacterized protein n=1 Tax=Bacillus toyonensis TaxID=155322 RepID=A0A2C5H4D6_9BACI|nr:hypothetical protein [Bacillus toyonensis]PFY35636.1 hypothetical protein COL54_28490 [Bacillus toyonensis]PGG78640.1 hypothetical protein CON73_31410 [Bacillus toyonensis]PHF80597.1 hypothetical protein COI63_35710 [Bacillus toyonensis]
MNKRKKIFNVIALPCVLAYTLLALGSAIYFKYWWHVVEHFSTLCLLIGIAALVTGKGKKKWVLILLIVCIIGNLLKITMDLWLHNYKDFLINVGLIIVIIDTLTNHKDIWDNVDN